MILVNQDNILLIFHASYLTLLSTFLLMVIFLSGEFKSLKNKTFQPAWLHDVNSLVTNFTQTASKTVTMS